MCGSCCTVFLDVSQAPAAFTCPVFVPPTLILHAEAPRLPFLVVGGCEQHGLCLQRRLWRREKGENLRMAFHRSKAEPEPPPMLVPV